MNEWIECKLHIVRIWKSTYTYWIRIPCSVLLSKNPEEKKITSWNVLHTNVTVLFQMMSLYRELRRKKIKHELDMQENQLPIKVYASSANLLVICSSSNKLISHVRNFISYVISSIFFSRFQWVDSFFAHKNSSESKRIRMEVPAVVIECSNYNLMSWSSYQLPSEFRAQLNVIVSLANK